MTTWTHPTRGDDATICDGCPTGCPECTQPEPCAHGRPWGGCFPCAQADEREALRRAIAELVAAPRRAPVVTR